MKYYILRYRLFQYVTKCVTKFHLDSSQFYMLNNLVEANQRGEI